MTPPQDLAYFCLQFTASAMELANSRPDREQTLQPQYHRVATAEGPEAMSITVRPAIAADLEAVLRLMRELAEHEGHSQYFQLTHESLTRYCFTTPARLDVLVAVGEEGIVGYATCMPQLSPWAGREYLFVDDVYVIATQRSRGVGALLMKRIGEIAIDRGMDVRWHVETENSSAQKFYRSLEAELRSRFIAYWSLESIRSYVPYHAVPTGRDAGAPS